MAKGKRHNCSTECSDAWAIKTTPSLMRRAVFQRDQGICSVCRVDTVAQKAEYLAIQTMVEREAFRKMVGVPPSRHGDWWDADHIKPVVEGGGECGLNNYRTLCIPCHKAETRKLRQRIATAGRLKRAVENDRQGLFADQVEGV
jgi:5-methylcytosine-specific restriction enzyme A